MKLIIGCANFGNLYGLKKKNLNLKKIFKIIKRAKYHGIYHFDTAQDYKNSETFLGNSIKKVYVKKKPLIDTKLPKLLYKQKIGFKIEEIVKSSIKKLNIKKINILYIHDVHQLTRKNGKKIYSELLKLKKKKLIKKIGISVYSVNETKKILKKFDIDVIQAPVNILENKFIDKKFISLKKKKKCVLIARSIFLKGLLLKNPLKLNKYFKKWENLLTKLNKNLKNKNISTKNWTINFINSNKNFKHFIIGVSKVSQLNEIVAILKKRKKIPNKANNLNIVSQKLINPKYWSI